MWFCGDFFSRFLRLRYVAVFPKDFFFRLVATFFLLNHAYLKFFFGKMCRVWWWVIQQHSFGEKLGWTSINFHRCVIKLSTLRNGFRESGDQQPNQAEKTTNKNRTEKKREKKKTFFFVFNSFSAITTTQTSFSRIKKEKKHRKLFVATFSFSSH